MSFEFETVIKDFYRMCEKYDFNCNSDDCPIARLIEKWEHRHNLTWDAGCLMFAHEDPSLFASTVEEWARNHPPKIYPTVGEVMNKLMELMGWPSTATYDEMFDMRLSEKAASYFGIEPINDTSPQPPID